MWNMKIRYLCHKVVTDQICGLEVTGLIPVNSYIFLFSYFGVDVDMNKTWTSICRMFFHMNMINIIICLKIANILHYWVFSHKKYLYVTLHPSSCITEVYFSMYQSPDLLCDSTYNLTCYDTSNTTFLTETLTFIYLITKWIV